MASHVRYVLKLNGGWYRGADVLRYLFISSKKRSIPEIIAAAKEARGALWVFREPRGTKYNKSRYRKLCAWVGIGKKKKKAVWGLGALLDAPPPIQPAGGQYVQYAVQYGIAGGHGQAHAGANQHVPAIPKAIKFPGYEP